MPPLEFFPAAFRILASGRAVAPALYGEIAVLFPLLLPSCHSSLLGPALCGEARHFC